MANVMERSVDVGLAIDAGTVLRVVDFVPGALSPMHRTNSVDYGVVVWAKSSWCSTTARSRGSAAGEVVIQRGTIHAWRNPSVETICRVAFVLVGACPATVGGEALEPVDV